jgi:hypothetical protein
MRVNSGVILVLVFVMGFVVSRAANGQGDENTWKYFTTSKVFSAPGTSDANRRAYLAGVYDATAGDALLVQFAKDYKARILAVLDCYTTKSKGDLSRFEGWAYGQAASTPHQDWSAASVVSGVCLSESGLPPAPAGQ